MDREATFGLLFPFSVFFFYAYRYTHIQVCQPDLIYNGTENECGTWLFPTTQRTTARQNNFVNLQLSAMDVLAPTTMKNAAKCDT